VAELRAGGFGAAELKDAKFGAADLYSAGFSVAELKAGGFSDADLSAAGNVLSSADTIVPSSVNFPAAESAANVLDGKSSTKYLNFDKLNTGFTVTPKAGSTVITGISITTANDEPERDPATWQVLGSNDGTTFGAIASGSFNSNPSRFCTETIAFSNTKAYTTYKVVFPTIVDASKANSMQVADVALHGHQGGGIGSGGGTGPSLVRLS
jgi:hypothetical protein